jgi:trypsin
MVKAIFSRSLKNENGNIAVVLGITFFVLTMVLSLNDTLRANIKSYLHLDRGNAMVSLASNALSSAGSLENTVGAGLDIPAASAPQNGVVDYLTGSVLANSDEFPSVVWIKAGPTRRCAGAIITATKVLTSAHCIAGLTASEITLVAGVTNPSTISAPACTANPSCQSRDIASFVIHPNYDSMTAKNDLALLSVGAPFITGVDVAIANYTAPGSAGESVTGVGWKNSAIDTSNLKAKVVVPVLSDAVVEALYGSGSVTNRFGTGETDGSISTGSNSVVFDGAGKLIGIGNFAYPASLSVQTRVHDYNSWIQASGAPCSVPTLSSAQYCKLCDLAGECLNINQYCTTFTAEQKGYVNAVIAGTSVFNFQYIYQGGACVSAGPVTLPNYEVNPIRYSATPAEMLSCMNGSAVSSYDKFCRLEPGQTLTCASAKTNYNSRLSSCKSQYKRPIVPHNNSSEIGKDYVVKFLANCMAVADPALSATYHATPYPTEAQICTHWGTASTGHPALWGCLRYMNSDDFLPYSSTQIGICYGNSGAPSCLPQPSVTWMVPGGVFEALSVCTAP